MFSVPDLLANVSSAAGIGILLDQVFVGRTGQQKIVQHLLRNQRPSSNLYKRFFDALNLVKSIIFDRALGGKFTSARYLLVSCAVSIIFISIIATYQNLYDGGVYSYLSSGGYSIAFFSLFCFANLFIDYLSFIQTNIFLNLAINSKKTSYTAFLIFGDIMSTMGIFKFLYSGFIFLILLACVSMVQNTELGSRDINIGYTVKRTTIDKNYLYSYDIIGTRTVSSDKYVFLDVHDARTNAPYIDPISFNNFRVENSISNASVLFDYGQKYNNVDPYIPLSHVGELRYEVSAKLHPPAIAFDFAKYAEIFNQVASVDYSFLHLISPSLVSIDVSESLGINYGFNPFNGSTYCGLPDGGRLFDAIYFPYLASAECSPKLEIAAGESYGDDTVYYSWDTAILDLKMPLSVFFVSSFSLTILIYALVLTLLLMGSITALAGGVRGQMVRYWARAPFGVFGAFLGLLLSLF